MASDALFAKAFGLALRAVRRNPDYKAVDFPDPWQFSRAVDDLLHTNFWD